METTKQILIPTDFSVCSKNAAEYAVRVFGETMVNYHLVHATEMPIPMPDGMYTTDGGLQKLDHELMDTTKEWFLSLVNQEKSLVTSEVWTGPIAGVVNAVADRVSGDLVVMGTHGMTSREDMLFGSNTSNFIANTKYPVLAVPSHYRFKPINKVLMACELEELEALENLAPVFEILQLQHAELEIFKVYDKVHVETTVEEEYNLRKLDDYFASVTHHFEEGLAPDPEAGILDRLDRGNFDMLVVFPRHRSLLSGLFHRSVTKRIALKSWVPTMFIETESQENE